MKTASDKGNIKLRMARKTNRTVPDACAEPMTKTEDRPLRKFKPR
jgi:hypothetical protein